MRSLTLMPVIMRSFTGLFPAPPRRGGDPEERIDPRGGQQVPGGCPRVQRRVEQAAAAVAEPVPRRGHDPAAVLAGPVPLGVVDVRQVPRRPRVVPGITAEQPTL